VGLLGNLKDVIDEDALTKGLAEKVVPALGKVLKELLAAAVDSVVGLTVTVGKKKPGDQP
jgi:hypothetical protein